MLGWPGDVETGGGAGVACRILAESLANAGLDVLLASPRPRAVVGQFGADVDEAHEKGLGRVPGPYMTAVELTASTRLAAEIRAIGQENRENEDPCSADFAGVVSDDAVRSEGLLPRAVAVRAEPEPSLGISVCDALEDAVQAFADEVSEIIDSESFVPDVVHAHDWFTFPAAREVAENHEVPVVFHVHSTEFDRHPSDYDLDIVERERQAAVQADRVIAVSDRTAEALSAKYDVPKDRIDVVAPDCPAPVIPGAVWQFPEFTVTFLGRVTDQKGPAFFLEVARKLLREDRDWRFLVVGDGDRLAQVIEWAALDGLCDRVHFVGHAMPKERDELLASTDLLLMPSLSEPFGLAAIEALRVGVPAFVSSQSGVAGWIPRHMQADYWDVDQICARLRELRDNPESLANALSDSVRGVEGLSGERQSALVGRCYKRALSRRGRS
jgi:glycosyltransferase involved in cell wall biosynthesis